MGVKLSVATAGLAATIASSVFAAEPPPQPIPHAPAALAGTSLVWCGDVVTPRAAPELYGDEPVYVRNEMPTQRIRRWARQRPGFVDVWIDRENGGWVNVMFTEDVARRQTELEREFPGVGVVAVDVEHSRHELRQLARRVGAFVQREGIPAGYGWGNVNNIVELGVPVMTEELASALDDAFAGEPLCVDGADPEDAPQPGPQPLAGDGWSMLGWEEGDGPAHEVGIATDQATYEQLWERARLEGGLPSVDFESDIVVWFAIGHGSSCPNQRMDEVIVDRARSQVYPLIVNPDPVVACTDDLTGAYQFVAAIPRAELPPGPFELGLQGGDGDLWRSLSIDADLTIPGSVVGLEGEGSAEPSPG